MYIAMVSAECAPVAKAGGLGDFVHGLSRETRDSRPPGRDLPAQVRFPALRPHRGDDQGLPGPLGALLRPVDSLRRGLRRGRRAQVASSSTSTPARRSSVAARSTANRDDADRFAFFSRAVLEFLLKSGKRPDIIHCNDWQTGLVPVLLFEIYQGLGMTNTRACFTLHNMGHQGVVGEYILRQVGLRPERLMVTERLQDPVNHRAVNLMKGGIVFSNFVTTVSPRYAWEIQHTDQGMGLQGLLQLPRPQVRRGAERHRRRGLEPGAATRHIPQTYGPDTLPRKAVNKRALRERLGLQDAFKPIVCVVSRLDRQKGVRPDPPRHLLRPGATAVRSCSWARPRTRRSTSRLLAHQAARWRPARTVTWSSPTTRSCPT